MTLFALTIAWLAGAVPVVAWGTPWWIGGAWGLAASAGLAAAGPLKGRYGLVAACVVVAALGGFRVQQGTKVHPPAWLQTRGSEVTVSGTVTGEPDRGLTTAGYTLKVEAIDASGARFSGGAVIVYLNQYADFLPGDRLVLRGKLDAPPRFDDFDFRAYLARRGIWGTMFRPVVVEQQAGGASLERWLTEARLQLDESLRRSLPEPQASLAAGIAFGRDDGLSDESKENYNRSGLRHLVAVSGSNVTLVAALTLVLSVPLVGRRYAWMPAAVSIAAYLAAAGFSASVLRAGVMAGIFLVGSAIGRPQSGLPALGAAVIAMTAVSPVINVDPGFQLSAAATAGIIAFAPWLRGWLMSLTARSRWTPVPASACQAVALTLAASLSTAPIMWHTFGRISLVSPLANVIVEPLFILAFWGSILAALLGLVFDPIGHLVGAAAFYPLAAIGGTAKFFAGFSWASVATPGSSVTLAIAATAALAGLALAAYRYAPHFREEPTRLTAKRKRTAVFLWAAAVGATAIAAVPVSILPARAHDELRIDFLDVGQGDAALVTTPGGQQFLIDGGPSGLQLARQLGEVMPHWVRTIEAVFLTHPQEDHLGGLPALAQRFSIRETYGTGFTNDTETFAYYHHDFPGTRTLTSGETLEFDGVRIAILWPPPGYVSDELNDTSLVLRLTYGETSVLFTGDSEAPVHEALAAAGAELRADVLKVPHHGSKTTETSFFAAVGASVAVISVGQDNIFGHPHANTLAALDGASVFRTDQDGRVTVRTDGRTIRVSSSR